MRWQDLKNNPRLKENLIKRAETFKKIRYFYWYSNQRKMSDLRVKQAIEKIKNSVSNY